MNRCRQSGEDFNVILTRYAIERLLYRLTRTRHALRFTLKGATLFAIWMDKPHRPTLDVDLLGFGEPSADDLQKVVQDICDSSVEPDGMRFDAGSIRVNEIREDNVYQGLRVKLTGYLGSARIPVQVDVGFGDVITPKQVQVTLASLLDLPAPVMMAYPPETVIAEKLEAMVVLGLANSRMKDFFDVYTLSQRMTFEGEVLTDAIRATFRRRRTPIPETPPIALSREFANDAAKRAQWSAFVKRIVPDDRSADLEEVIETIRRFVEPAMRAAASNTPFPRKWRGAEMWRE